MNNRKLRIKSDLQSVTNDITDVLTSASPKFFAGEDVSIQVGVFTGSTVEDVSNVTSVITEIKALAAGGPPLGTSAYLVQKTNSSFDNTLDSATWNDGSKQHFTITLTDTDTGSLKEGIKWISSYAVLSDGTKITLFAGKIQVTEDGTGDSSGSDTAVATLSTAGDLLTHDGTTPLRKARGADGTYLQSDDADTDGDGSYLTWKAAVGISGPNTSTDNAIGRFNGIDGSVLQNSTASIDDSGNLDVQGNITVSGTVDGRDIATDGTKLDGIEANATADQTGSEIKTLYEAEANTNAYTDAEKTKLAGIETAATADQTGAEIKALYEAEANTNAYTDAEVSKLAGIEASADVTDAANVTSALSGAVITSATVAATDKVLLQDADDLDNLKVVTAQSIADLAPTVVDSVNGKTGVVVINPDDLSDAATTNKFTTASDIAKLAGIEASADVTDATNVISSLSGATITSATVAADDKVLIQDTNDSNNLKQVTAQSIANLASGNLDLISSTTISSTVSSVSFTSGLDDATYADLLVVFNNITSNGTANAEMMLTVSTDGGSTYSTANAKQRMVQTGQDSAKNARNTYGRWDNTGGALSIDYISADTSTTAYNLRSGGSLSGYLRIFNHQGSTNKIVQSDVTHEHDGTNFYIFNIESGGMIDETGSIDAIKFSFNGGTISFTGGTINLYGVKNS